MTFYIDFDHTLYNNNEMINDMINLLAHHIYESGNFENYESNFKRMFHDIDLIPMNRNLEEISRVVRENFKRPEQTTLKIKYNIFTLAKAFCELFECDYEKLNEKIISLLDNGRKIFI